MKITLGIDPDTRDMAIAAWDDEGPRSAQVCHLVGANRTGEQSQVRMARMMAEVGTTTLLPGTAAPFAIAIEGQQVDRRKVRPADLFTLAHTTGTALLWCVMRFNPMTKIVVTTPDEWKGGVAKHAHQGRLYKALGWGSEVIGSGKSRYARPLMIPKEFSHIKPGQWKHVGDALLLAKWAYENIKP